MGRPWKVTGRWRQAAQSSAWAGRDGAGLLSLGNDLFLLGGWNPAWTPKVVSHVWKSSNRGASFQQLADAPWAGRHSAGWVTHDNSLWVLGGDTQLGSYQTDVWRGDIVGGIVEWTRLTAYAEWALPGRVLHQAFSHAGRLWVVGGQTWDESADPPALRPQGPYYADVWSSVDGASWTKVADNCPWSPRASIIGSAVKDGFMWLVGGGAYDTQGRPRIYLNDVWKSADGVAWTRVTANGGFPARQYNNVLALAGSLVLLAGYDGDNRADAWISDDGATWAQLKDIPWQARHAASAVVHKGEIIFLGGPLDDTAVWAMS